MKLTLLQFILYFNIDDTKMLGTTIHVHVYQFEIIDVCFEYDINAIYIIVPKIFQFNYITLGVSWQS